MDCMLSAFVAVEHTQEKQSADATVRQSCVSSLSDCKPQISDGYFQHESTTPNDTSDFRS